MRLNNSVESHNREIR
jgi:chromosome segregation ATPase